MPSYLPYKAVLNIFSFLKKQEVFSRLLFMYEFFLRTVIEFVLILAQNNSESDDFALSQPPFSTTLGLRSKYFEAVLELVFL